MKKYFFAGILVWAPLAITIWVINWGLSILDDVFGSVMRVIITVSPSGVAPALEAFREIPGVGILIILLVIIFTGMFAITFAGRWILRVADSALARIPVVRSIYTGVKQVSDTLFSGNGESFRRAVLIRYPHADSWAIAFHTGNTFDEVNQKLGGTYINVFVPTTPNPTSGFFMVVRKDSVIELSIPVEDALKHIVSMGSVAPGVEIKNNS